MASPSIYENGLNLAGTVFENGPASLQLAGTVYLSATIQWVDTISGSNANPGDVPNRPVQTLAQALTNSAANGLIIIGEGSSESLGSSQVISLAGVSIMGCGAGSSRPRYTCTGTIDMWSITAAGVWVENFYFPASTAVAISRIAFTAANGTVKDSYFECGASDTNRALRIHTAANSCRASSCSFVVTASRPSKGLEISAAVTDSIVENCTFDGGSYGWTDYAFKVSAAATRTRDFGNTFTNESSFGHTITGTTYQVFGNDVRGTGITSITA